MSDTSNAMPGDPWPWPYPQGVPYPVMPATPCVHCWCEDWWKPEHAACCKCGTGMHVRFVPGRAQPEPAAGARS